MRALRATVIAGARPNMMKVAPILDACARRADAEPLFVHTGQHYDESMSEVFLRELGMPKPDIHLGVGAGTHAETTARVMLGLEPVLMERRPDVVVVVGDVNSTVAATLTAAKLGIPVAHVEAGLRSFDRTMPEELNRIVTDALSRWLFTTEPAAAENLAREGVPAERVHFVGNTMIDTLLRHRERAEALRPWETAGVERGGYAIATLHRPSNVDSAEALERTVELLRGAAERLPVVFPVHPRTRARLESGGLVEQLASSGRVQLLTPQPYLAFLGLMAGARVVLTDSGGIQEETTVLGVPCLTMRENTERPITISAGTNRLVGSDAARVLPALDEVLADGTRQAAVPPLWDGRAAERILDVLVAEAERA